ncbi:MAG: PKD domain-containing protein, partial [Chitinophagales bacterium]|nr:PKD domain-containing protein [Chitinophagales bacterium]
MMLKISTLLLTISIISLTPLTGVAQNCQAAFSFDGTDITIQFTDESTSAPGDPIVSWSWDFDDGTNSNQQNPLHTFPDADNYFVTLTIVTQSECSSTVEIEIEICVLNVSLDVGTCDASGNVPLQITVSDPYDAAIAINISIDGQLLPGSPFDIDDDAPVTTNYSMPGDGLQHTLVVQSEEVGTCSETIIFSVPDCNSNCFLSALNISAQGGATHVVDVGDNFFSPVNTTITIGDIVEFQWVGDGHTTTSDATSGPDSWNSGELGFGAVYQVDITNPGVHSYYCIPHGGPGGVGMAGTIVANCPPSGQFTLNITFNTTQADPAGYNLIIDGVVQPGSPFSYVGTGPQSVQANLAGDGVSHTIEIVDVATPSCVLSTTWQAPDCGAAPTCSLSVTAVESGACNAANQVPVNLTVNAINPGNAGFNVFVDGAPASGNPYTYNGSGVTTVTINVAGDGQSHTIEVVDLEDAGCSATTTITTTDCSIPCVLSNLTASTGSSAIHTVEVLDFDFSPANITITSGDIVEWIWVGAVDHTTTSDATSGPDSWDSGLLGTGATYESPVLTAGVHPYYCIPHGAPGGVGMAGTITVQANCTNGMVSVNLSFNEQGGSANGYMILVDGGIVGTYSYDASGTNSISIQVPGDGQQHIITIEDVDDTTCTTATTITTPDCNAPTCQLSVTANESGGCDSSNELPVLVEVSDVGGGASGFSLSVDGVPSGTYNYSGTGTTTVTISIAGDGQSHTIEVVDLEDATCSATTSITTTDCSIPCVLSDLTASTGS